MTELSKKNPTGRFAGLADIYSRCRPSYPPEAIDYIVAHCGLEPGSILIDVGCGTGISSRLFSERGIQVIGIEPNADMLAKAREAAEKALEELRLTKEAGEERAVRSAGTLAGTDDVLLEERSPGSAAGPPASIPDYREGKAEETGIAPAYADVVVSAQAFHWFRPEESLHEFHRILKPSGWCVLMWNERDESDEFTAAYGTLLRTLPDTASVEMPRGVAGNALLESAIFTHRQRKTFANEQILDQDGLLGRAFSASYAPREPKRIASFSEELRQLFDKYAKDGTVTMRYETSVYTGQVPA